MLLNILPGFRELRAPLAAGYLWLLAGWLAFGDSISAPEQAEDFLDQFSALGQAAALTFGAYIVGSLLSDLSTPVWEFLRRFRLWRKAQRWAKSQQKHVDTSRKYADQARKESEELREVLFYDEEDERLRERLREVQGRRDNFVTWAAEGERLLDVVPRALPAATEPVSLRGLRTIASLEADFPSDAPDVNDARLREASRERDGSKAAAIAGELDIARFRLLAEQRDLFNEVDRLRGEAQFRLAVAGPLAALAITLGFSEHVAWVLAVIPALALAWQGMNKLEESGDRIADALRAGKVHIPGLGPQPEEPDKPVEEKLQQEPGGPVTERT